MIYAVYKRMGLDDAYSSNDLKVMNDIELQKMVMNFLMDEAKIDEEELNGLNFDELIALYEDTLLDMNEEENYMAFDRVLIVNAKNKVIVDV